MTCRSLELDGSDDYVMLNQEDGPFSVLAWVKGRVPGPTIIRQNDAGGSGQTWLGTEPSEGKLITTLTDSGRFTSTLGSGLVVTDGDWHHVRVVLDGSHRSRYADGVNVAEDTTALSALDASQNGFYLGAGKTQGEGSLWAGFIDDVRIYSRAPNL
ncbi:MAG: LamG domain-containing protein [Phycisphaerales bacterium]|nr:MAG: LamG domain-containing protein [Phycisphaerales bacterium]